MTKAERKTANRGWCQSYYQRNKKVLLKKNKEWQDSHAEYLKNYRRKQYKKNKRVFKDRELRKRYGISLEEKERRIKKQRYKCALCKTPNPGRRGWNTDHDPKTHQVRSELCTQCNLGLGNFKESSYLLQRASKYLQMWRS